MEFVCKFQPFTVRKEKSHSDQTRPFLYGKLSWQVKSDISKASLDAVSGISCISHTISAFLIGIIWFKVGMVLLFRKQVLCPVVNLNLQINTKTAYDTVGDYPPKKSSISLFSKHPETTFVYAQVARPYYSCSNYKQLQQRWQLDDVIRATKYVHIDKCFLAPLKVQISNLVYEYAALN